MRSYLFENISHPCKEGIVCNTSDQVMLLQPLFYKYSQSQMSITLKSPSHILPLTNCKDLAGLPDMPTCFLAYLRLFNCC